MPYGGIREWFIPALENRAISLKGCVAAGTWQK
jgi:hypothetical protein